MKKLVLYSLACFLVPLTAAMLWGPVSTGAGTAERGETDPPATRIDYNGETELATVYWSNGKIKAQGKMFAGIRQGTWKEFYPNGKMAELGNYKDNKRIGDWTFWREDGKIDRMERYPWPSPTGNLPIRTDEIEALAANGCSDWRSLALTAAYLNEFSASNDRDDRELREKALEYINQSIEKEAHYWNVSIKAKILSRLDFNASKKAAERAIELGIQEVNGFAGSEDEKILQRMLEMDGC